MEYIHIQAFKLNDGENLKSYSSWKNARKFNENWNRALCTQHISECIQLLPILHSRHIRKISVVRGKGPWNSRNMQHPPAVLHYSNLTFCSVRESQSILSICPPFIWSFCLSEKIKQFDDANQFILIEIWNVNHFYLNWIQTRL